MNIDYSELTVSLKGSGLVVASCGYLFSVHITASLNTPQA